MKNVLALNNTLFPCRQAARSSTAARLPFLFSILIGFFLIVGLVLLPNKRAHAFWNWNLTSTRVKNVQVLKVNKPKPSLSVRPPSGGESTTNLTVSYSESDRDFAASGSKRIGTSVIRDNKSIPDGETISRFRVGSIIPPVKDLPIKILPINDEYYDHVYDDNYLDIDDEDSPIVKSVSAAIEEDRAMVRETFSSGVTRGQRIRTGQSREDDELPRIHLPELEEVRSDVMPMFVLGDLDEDGIVDPWDLELLSALVEEDDRDSASCAAAGDLTLDGEIDAADVERLASMVGNQAVIAPALYGQPYLPCNYDNLLVAATPDFIRVEPLRLRFVADTPVAEVEIVGEGSGEIAPSEDGPGWDIHIHNLAAGESFTIKMGFGDRSYLYTLAGVDEDEEQSEDDDEEESEEWIDAGEDDGEVPGDSPPPTIFGELIDSDGLCPQKDQGCESLVIDFAKHNDMILTDADQTHSSLGKVKCNVTYVAPRFQRIPKPYVISIRSPTLGISETLVYLPVDPNEVALVRRNNLRGWKQVRAAIKKHRKHLREGRELVYQLVNGHGSGNFGFGYWGPSFSTGTGTLRRSTFHTGNYYAREGKCLLCRRGGSQLLFGAHTQGGRFVEQLGQG